LTELEENHEAEALLEKFGAKPSEAPVTMWQGENVRRSLTNSELACTIGLKIDAPWERTYDFAVVGAGPAGLGLGASVYGLRRVSLPSSSNRWPWEDSGR
jgi:thioredoxin reductase (NADPH)